jgi:phage gp36-like protein
MAAIVYATIEDLEKRYGSEISDLQKAEGKSLSTVDAALEDAAAEINGYIGQRYRLPLPQGGGYSVLVWLSCDIARFRLWESRLEDSEDNTVYVRYRKAIAFLEGIAKGETALISDEGQEPEVIAGVEAACVISTRPVIFTNSMLRKMNYGS